MFPTLYCIGGEANLNLWMQYSQKSLFKAKTTLLNQFGPSLREKLSEDVQGHHEAVFMDVDAIGAVMHVDQAPSS
jgi:hypothetical protein